MSAEPRRRIYPPFEVRRLDENTANEYTYGQWVLVSCFETREAAEDYVRRAAGPTQKLRVQENTI